MKRIYLLLFTALMFVLVFIPSENAFAIEMADDAENINAEVTNISVSGNDLEWEDEITIDIRYTSPAKGEEIELAFGPLDVDEENWADKCVRPYFYINDDNNNNIIYEGTGIKDIESTYDAKTGEGRIKYTQKLGRWDTRAQKVKLFKVRLKFKDLLVWRGTEYWWYCLDLDIPDKDSCLYEVKTPLGSAAFDRPDNEEGFMDALNGLQDGDLAVVRPRSFENKTDPRYGTYSEFIFPKEYYDAIKGKDVTLIVMPFPNFFVINGKDIINETKDVYLLGWVSTRVHHYNNGTRNYNCEFVIPFSKNGVLPCKTRYYYNYEEFYQGLYDLTEDSDWGRITRDDFNYSLDNCKIYYVNNGELIDEGMRITRDGDYFYYDLEHNSTFIATDAKSENIRSFSVARSNYRLTYTGKVLKPSIKVKCDDGTSYSKKYSNSKSKKVGIYKVTLKGTKGGYGTRVVKYTIIPKGTGIRSVDASRKGFTAKWKKQSIQTTGYQLQYSTSSGFKYNNKTVTISRNGTVSKKVTNLKAKKRYYVRVRTYKTVNGTKIYSKWSAKASVKTK